MNNELDRASKLLVEQEQHRTLNAYELEARVNAIDLEKRQTINLRLGLPPELNRRQRRARMKGK